MQSEIHTLSGVVNEQKWDVANPHVQAQCKQQLLQTGVLVLPDFLTESAVHSLQNEGAKYQHLAYYTQASHNVYLAPSDEQYPNDHPRNRSVVSSKGCITTDQIPANSKLKQLYASPDFKKFLCAVLDETALYEYADALSSINLHYAADGQELGWHFDNSSFAITLLVQKPEKGGTFEYVKNLRNTEQEDAWNFEGVDSVLAGRTQVQSLAMEAGSLVLFRGKNSLHRVTPSFGKLTRMLAVLAYNAKPDIALSESARKTFYGRL